MSEKILSVGIDIGTSTTSVIFSSIVIKNTSGYAKIPSYTIIDKKVFYKSDIHLTPLQSNTKLDIAKILEIVRSEYKKAGILQKDVNTGAVIITGDTARKENAKEVLKEISSFAGDFVVTAAGPELESILAGKGSGADKISLKNSIAVMNLDLGGGTTNAAIFKDGKVVDVACFDIGGRLIRFEPGSLKISYISKKTKELGKNLGLSLDSGSLMTNNQVVKICDSMAEGIIDVINQNIESLLYKFYLIKESGFKLKREVRAVTFSGGVGDIIYSGEIIDEYKYNDIGVVLAGRIKKRVEQNLVEIIKPYETIGATVIGAGIHTTEVSGSTIKISNLSVLPLKNIPLIKTTEKNLELEVKSQIKWLTGDDDTQQIAIYLEGPSNISFNEVENLAKKIIDSTKEYLLKNKLLIIVLLNDFAKVLGQSLMAKLEKNIDVIVIDGLNASLGDYIDIGVALGGGSVVPVIIKTLFFNY